MVLDLSNDLFNQLLQESTDSLVFSPLSVVNLIWIYINAFVNLSGHEWPEFSAEDLEQCKRIYNQEFKDLNSRINRIFIESCYSAKRSKSYVQTNNFIFCNVDLKLINTISDVILKSQKIIIQEFGSNIKIENLSKLITYTVTYLTGCELNKLSQICHHDIRNTLLNTTLYKNVWKFPFSSELISETFHINENESKEITMMQKTEKMWEIETGDFQMVEIICSVNSLRFIAVLPKNNMSLQDVHKLITKDNRNGIHDIMAKSERRNVCLKIPKFKVESTFDILSEMKTEVVKKLFKKENGNEEFKKIITLFLNSKEDFKHVAMVDISEKGVKEIESNASSYFTQSEPVKEITFNKPFLFYIVDLVWLDNIEPGEMVFIPCFMGKYSGESN
ncbi:serpin-type proteinase inhibitor 7 [Vairimorpha necatrix]|uniref:Serpin-type proteinase inhibitor 7 n=1 Tax=Vairimorpha necatrix TaxID=6039 RepID=A0AAX4JHZ4_9MICR